MIKDITMIIALAINNFNVLKLNIACLVHFQVMDNKKMIISISVDTVPIATPIAGLSLKTNPPNTIDKMIFKTVPTPMAIR